MLPAADRSIMAFFGGPGQTLRPHSPLAISIALALASRTKGKTPMTA